MYICPRRYFLFFKGMFSCSLGGPEVNIQPRFLSSCLHFPDAGSKGMYYQSQVESSDPHSLLWYFLSASYTGPDESCFFSNSRLVLLTDHLCLKLLSPNRQ